MAGRWLENRRTAGIAGTIAVHVIVVGALIVLGLGPAVVPKAVSEAFVSVALRDPPPPPPPPRDQEPEAAAAPPSQGTTAEPAPVPMPRPLPKPAPVKPSTDVGPARDAGLGAAAGTGAGQGGEGDGRGSGNGGSGSGGGTFTPPVHIAGNLTNGDYRAARAPSGAAGTVRVSFRIRSDGSVDQCRVTGSSGFPQFDQATCRLIEQRFRFRPALDEQGRAIDWAANTDYTWAPR